MQDFYTSLEDAKVEIQKRWQDEELKERVRVYLGGKIPEPFLQEPRAVLGRNIATPDLECMRFVKLSEQIVLSPAIFEGLHDKFASLATDKMGLVKLSFFDGYDKNGGVRNHYRKIVDIPQFDGKPFTDITTLWGENLVAFHHRLLRAYITQKVELFDDLQWYKDTVGGSTEAKEYYKVMMAYFVVHGVQFENYVTDDSEQEFFDTVVKPAFDFVTEEFGVRPLIVPLAPQDEASSPYWWCYNKEIESELNK